MNKLINICGAGRTGSTMFDLILGNDPKAFSLGEVHAWFRPFRTHHFDIKCACGIYPCEVWEKIKNINEKEFHKNIFDILNVNYLIDSSKELTWVIDNNEWAKEHGTYDIFNFLIYKKPEEFAYSYWKRKKSIDEGLKSYRYYHRFIKSNLNFVSINYSEFVKQPNIVLKKMCDIIQMEFFENKIKFWEKTHHHLFGSYGTRKQVSKNNSKIYEEQFSPEFRKIIPQINKKVKKNRTIGEVLEILEQKEIGKPPSKKYSAPVKKSFYYYSHKIKSRIKKRFPEKYFDREAKLIKKGNTTYK